MIGELAGERVRVDLATGAISGQAAGEPLGHLALEDDGETLFIRELCIDAGARGLGAGSECVRLLRDYAEAGQWRVLRAWAPPDIGLAVYFWSRMGLRPMFGEGPGGGIWFERRLDSSPPA
ncbi:MAG: GNAT family N-acetyltransferase [Dehalococcoidia bacterium]